MELQERMKGLAFIQVRAAREADGGLLDFTQSSLAALDRLIDRDVSRQPADVEALSEVIGAYLGETMVRRLGARWQEGGDGRPQLALGAIRLDPLRRARLRVERGPERSLAGYFGAVRAAIGSGDTAADLEDG